ncbi:MULTISPECIES: hypothetical protein, partial [unclassified Frankia]
KSTDIGYIIVASVRVLGANAIRNGGLYTLTHHRGVQVIMAEKVTAGAGEAEGAADDQAVSPAERFEAQVQHAVAELYRNRRTG